MEWTPEAIKAEIDYRQTALHEAAEHARALRRRSATPKRSWWKRLARRAEPEIPRQRNGEAEAA